MKSMAVLVVSLLCPVSAVLYVDETVVTFLPQEEGGVAESYFYSSLDKSTIAKINFKQALPKDVFAIPWEVLYQLSPTQVHDIVYSATEIFEPAAYGGKIIDPKALEQLRKAEYLRKEFLIEALPSIQSPSAKL